MNENKFPKKEFIILSVGEALCVLVTALAFWGVDISGIFEFEFSYKVITGALLGAVVILLNFLFLSMSVNKAVDEYMNLRGDKEMTDEEAEAFAQKNSMLLQNAVKKSFIVRVVSIAASLVVAFLLDWFHPLATIVPIIAYQPILTWGNHIYDSAKRIIVRFKSNGKEVAETLADISEEDEADLDVVADDAEGSIEEFVTEDFTFDEALAEPDMDEPINEEDIAESSEDVIPMESDEIEDITEEKIEKIEGEEIAPEENKENTEGSDIDEL